MFEFPFLKPKLPSSKDLEMYLSEMDRARVYSNFGPLNYKFQQRILNEYFDGSGDCLTVNNGTTGLIACIATSKRPNAKYALMPSFTFAATPLAAIWAGLEPFFIDVDINTWNMCHSSLENAIQTLGPDVAVIVAHAAFGNSPDLKYYSSHVSRGIPVVIDAAAGFGTRINGKQFGIGFDGTLTFSFHATKTFGIGEGGLIYSADKTKIEEIKKFCNFGFNESRETEFLGLNAKLSEFHAAVGLAELDKFPNILRKRRQIWRYYIDAIKQNSMVEKGWRLQQTNASICYQFLPILAPEGLDNDQIVGRMAENSIELRKYFSPPCHLHKRFQNYNRCQLKNTEMMAKRVLSLPGWHSMSRSDINHILTCLNHA